jgi:hypothetical protein
MSKPGLSTEDKGLILEVIVGAALAAMQSPEYEDFDKWIRLLYRLAKIWNLDRTISAILGCDCSHYSAADWRRDTKWVNTRIHELNEIPNHRGTFDMFVRNPEVRSVMARLKKENTVLYERAYRAFIMKEMDLPKPKKSARPEGLPRASRQRE